MARGFKKGKYFSFVRKQEGSSARAKFARIRDALAQITEDSNDGGWISLDVATARFSPRAPIPAEILAVCQTLELLDVLHRGVSYHRESVCLFLVLHR